MAVDRGLQLLAVTNFACCLSRLLHLQHRCPECDIFEMTLLHLQVRHLREDTSASTTPPPRVGKLRDDAPSPHPLEAALLRDEQPPVNQHQILEDYLKQVLASAGLVSQEHFPEVVSMIKNMDSCFETCVSRCSIQRKYGIGILGGCLPATSLPAFCSRKIVAGSMLACRCWHHHRPFPLPRPLLSSMRMLSSEAG